MKYLILLGLSLNAFAQSSMDEYRWYLNPNGQEVLVSIDDLHDEHIIATPAMNWGREAVKDVVLKKEVVVAVIDGGFDVDHPELRDHIAHNTVECYNGTTIPPQGGEDKDGNGYKGDCAGYNFVDDNNRAEDLDGHGTHVTGIIQTVMSGVNGTYKFLPLKAFAPNEGKQGGPQGLAPLSTRLTKAFLYAVSRNVDVIHLSVGWPKSYMSSDLENAIKTALQKGILIVAAAGNSSQRATIYPCQMEGVICVGALRANGGVARFSNWGTQVDIFAPGERILSTIPYSLTPTQITRKGYDFKNGTSQAAPFISAAAALLRGAFPDEPPASIFARLMAGADPAVDRKGLRGLFHLDRSLATLPASFIFPSLKGMQSVLLDETSSFALTVPFKNYGIANGSSPVSLACKEADVHAAKSTIALGSFEDGSLSFSGTFRGSAPELNCDLTIGAQIITLKLKVLRSLKTPLATENAPQNGMYVVNTRNGGRSRFLTLNALPGSVPAPYYVVGTPKELQIYEENVIAGKISLKDGCKLLRMWQGDLTADGINDIMMESLCDKVLQYRFFDHQLKELFSEITYRPTLTIMNYEDFEVVPQKDLPPALRFINMGYSIPSASPWDHSASGRSTHLYEMFPKKDSDGSLKYDVRILEDQSKWQKSLGLRYLPDAFVYHRVGRSQLLVKIGGKSALVNIDTQAVAWAPQFDRILIDGTRKQTVFGENSDILQGFLTPYEYRGYLLSGVTLKFTQESKTDPLIDILATTKNALGYLSVLQSFQKLIFLQYDSQGMFLSKTETTVERFDFLTTQDLLASVINLKTSDGLIQIEDGTKLNTSYIDVIKNGHIMSYDVPVKCVTQQPVYRNDVPVLPLFCPVDNAHFEMRFIEL